MSQQSSPVPVKPAGHPVRNVILGILLGCMAFAWFSHRARHGVWAEIAQKITGRELTITDQAPAVIASIQRLQRLETVNFTMDKIVEGAVESNYLPDFLAGDRLLLVVHGQVIAGVDLSKLQSGNISIQDHAVRLRLPDPEIFTVSLDNNGTHVYSRTTGLLVPEDANLETETRQKAIEQLRQAALDGGILNKARDNARAAVTTLLQGLGFQQITIT